MKIAVDVDGVLLDIVSVFFDICNREHGTELTMDMATGWGFYQEHGISDDLAWKIFDRIQSDLDELKVIDDTAIDILKDMNARHIIDIVTVRKGKRKSELKKKLDTVGIHKGSHYRKIVTAPHKPYDAKLSYGYDVYIDDNPHLAHSLDNNDAYLVMFDQPWNRSIKNRSNVIRADNWDSIPSIIRDISGLHLEKV